MNKPVLTYFDIDAGRGEPLRLALHIGGVAFEDRRIPFKEWPGLRDSTPFQGLPTLETAGALVSQSNSLLRYAGKLAGLYPKDDVQALLCDEILDAVEDIGTRIGRTIQMEPEQKKKAREELAAGALKHHLRTLQAMLMRAGGQYFVEKRLTVADLKAFNLLRWLRSGVLDDIPKDLVDTAAPQLVPYFERIAAEPGVAGYYAARKKAA